MLQNESPDATIAADSTGMGFWVDLAMTPVVDRIVTRTRLEPRQGGLRLHRHGLEGWL
jgi:hypothetical protein